MFFVIALTLILFMCKVYPIVHDSPNGACLMLICFFYTLVCLYLTVVEIVDSVSSSLRGI